jgi:hypothetical protein
VTVLRTTLVVPSTDRSGAVSRCRTLFAAPPLAEFHLPGRDLVVTVFPGLSVLSGSTEALSPLRDLRGTVFVDSLGALEARLVANGWTRQGSLGSAGSLLARDPDGNLLEFVEEMPPNQSAPPRGP